MTSARRQIASRRLRVLLIASHLDADDVGESLTGFRLVEELANRVELTVVAMQRATATPLDQQLPNADVVAWPEPAWLLRQERFNAMLKPAWPVYVRWVRRWMRREANRGRHFDLAHQLLPRSPRYPSPLRGSGITYLIGPVGGGLTTPSGYEEEIGRESWYTRLRMVDSLRFRHDPWLRATYREAELVLGVSPYMSSVLRALPMKQYSSFLGIGLSTVPPVVERAKEPGVLRLLHVGRAVRTKGLRDVVRALAHLHDLPHVTLTSVGGGPDLEPTMEEARRLGVAHRVTFLGPLPHQSLPVEYRKADVFVFPSVRESMGAVLYEAMSWGLPVVTAARGGPDHIVDDSCGVRLPVTTPEGMTRSLASTVRTLATDPVLRTSLGASAREKVAAEALWSMKADAMLDIYQDVVSNAPAKPPRRHHSHQLQ